MVNPFRFSTCVVWLLFAITPLHAQTPPAANLINIREVTAEPISSPNYDIQVRGRSPVRDGRREWLQVIAEYDTALEWTDQITFTFYVALTGEASDLPEGSKTTNVFSGTVTYVNVPEARKQTVDMFLDANTYQRYGKVIAVALEVQVNGQNAAFMTEPKSLEARRWWETETPNVIPLLPRSETPYQMMEIDRQGTQQP
jgi:hypothetical protein